jgi:flotillin
MQLDTIINFFANNIALAVLLLIVIVVLLLAFFMRKYIRIYPPFIFFVHLRNGKAINQGEGGRVIKIPFFDDILTVDKTVQQLAITNEAVLSKEKQMVRMTCVLQWQAENAVSVINNVDWEEIPARLTAIIESVIRTSCAQLKVETILEERQEIIEDVKKELERIIVDWGIRVVTVELIEVECLNANFLKDMARPREAEMKKSAELSEIETQRVTTISDVEKKRQIQVATIEATREMGVKEQLKDKEIREAEMLKDLAVQEIDLKREVMQKEYEKKQAEIEAAKEKEVTVINAEAELQKKLRDEIKVEAERKIQIAEAQAQQRLRVAEADAASIKMEAEAEANRVASVGKAEAEAIFAKLDAEASGALALAKAELEKRKAQKEYTPQEFTRDFVQMLPRIYENIDIGDITTMDLGGVGGVGADGESLGTTKPYEVFGNVLLPMMIMAKMLGFDVTKVMKEGLGKYADKDGGVKLPIRNDVA